MVQGFDAIKAFEQQDRAPQSVQASSGGFWAQVGSFKTA